jgi:hypothetical protein
MKNVVKMSLAALAVAAAIPVFAEETASAKKEKEVVYEGAIGWTPVAVGLASPVQVPWGRAVWDVFGLDCNLFYSDAPKMYGLGVGGVAMATRDDLAGVQASLLCNWADADVYGIRATAGANITFGETYGVEAGIGAYRPSEMWGVDVELLGAYQHKFNGLQVAGLATVSKDQSYGMNAALFGNYAATAYGLQLAAIINYTSELHGCQIAFVNIASECPWGFQIGLVNIILDNAIKVLPFVNCYF